MHFGLHIQPDTIEAREADIYKELLQSAMWAEESGFKYFSVVDHLVPYNAQGSSDAPSMDCWTTLGALAQATDRINLLPLVINASIRQPSLVAQAAATLDLISRGRMLLGIGAGGYKPEYVQHGIPYPSDTHRAQRLTESLQVIKRLWSEDEVSFSGEFHELRNATISPKPVHKPAVLVAGASESVLNIAAAQGDMANVILPGPAQAAKVKTRLDQLTEELGRPAVKLTILERFIVRDTDQDAKQSWSDGGSPSRNGYPGTVGSPSTIAQHLNSYAQAGVCTVFAFFRKGDLQSREMLAAQIPDLAGHN